MRVRKSKLSKINVGKKPQSAKNTNYTGRDERIRAEYINKITGKKSPELKVIG